MDHPPRLQIHFLDSAVKSIRFQINCFHCSGRSNLSRSPSPANFFELLFVHVNRLAPFVLALTLAELERESILERQREGIEIAKAEGKYKGRKPVAIDEAKFRAVCARWRVGEITATAAMQEVGLKPNTFYRRVKDTGM